MKRLAHFIAVLSMIAAVLGLPAGAAADSRCGGQQGYQAWQDTGLNGVSFIRCADVQSLLTVTDNIAVGDWNDRISSWQTFDQPSSYTCLFENTGWTYSVASHNSRIFGSNTVLNLTSSANDRASSVAMNVTGSDCPIS